MFNATFNNISSSSISVHDSSGTFSHNFSYIVAVIFIGGGNRGIRRKQPTWRKSLTNFITSCCIEHTSVSSAGFEHTTLVVIGTTDCIGSCKSNCHTITTAPIWEGGRDYWIRFLKRTTHARSICHPTHKDVVTIQIYTPLVGNVALLLSIGVFYPHFLFNNYRLKMNHLWLG